MIMSTINLNIFSLFSVPKQIQVVKFDNWITFQQLLQTKMLINFTINLFLNSPNLIKDGNKISSSNYLLKALYNTRCETRWF